MKRQVLSFIVSLTIFATTATTWAANNLTLDSNVSCPGDAMSFAETNATLTSDASDVYDFSTFNPSHESFSLGNFNLNGGISDSILLSLNDGALYSTGGAIRLIRENDASVSVGDIEIYDVGEIDLGDGYIKHILSGGGGGGMGSINIGEAASPAGPIQVASIESYNKKSEGIYIHSSGDVHIRNAANTAGNIQCYGRVEGDMHVLHAGSFSAATVELRQDDSGNAGPYEVLFNGAAYAAEPSGTFVADEIIADGNNSDNSWNHVHANSVQLLGYLSVTVSGNIEAQTTQSTSSNKGDGGDITVTNIVNDIVIGGTIDAHSYSYPDDTSERGILTLQAGGRIELASLNLRKVQYAVIQPGTEAEITGLITGADGAALAGDGAGALSNAGTAMLRVPSGKDLIYYPDQNPDLQGGEYTLADEDGTVGDGGTLKPYTPQGTVFIVR